MQLDKALGASKKQIDASNLVRISALDFSEGMFVATELYVKLGNNYVLLCSNSALTPELIDKLNDFEITGESLYIDKDYYSKMGRHNRLPSNKTDDVIMQQYQELQDLTYSSFHQIDQSERVPWESMTKLSNKIYGQLELRDSPALLQCISTLRRTDQYLYAHSVNVALLNGLMAKWLKKSKLESGELIHIGLLHDIGKLRIPPSVLNKPGKLTAKEFNIIKQHPVHSERILISSGMSDPKILAAVRGHHEQMNGCGYPDKLSADMIPEYARITAISDIYDAMIAKRVYKDPASPFEVLDNFATDKFSFLDIQLVNVFIDHVTLELVGKYVRLSTGSIGKVLYVNKDQLAYPIVKVGGKTVTTNKDLRCVALISE